MKSFRNEISGEVRFSISPQSNCPCGSQIETSNCCLTESGFKKMAASTSPPTPKTCKSINSCYANSLADCDNQISKEHYISQSLLNHLNQSNDLRVSGFKWLKDDEAILPPGALVSKILCRRHNSALSKLDASAIHFFNAFDEKEAQNSRKQSIHLFNGHDLERWLLKILCGIIYSRNMEPDAKLDTLINNDWVSILFGEEDFANGQGLYLCKSPGHIFQGPYGVKLQIITKKNVLTGIGIWICGYELILSMSGFPNRIFDGREVVYRPLELYATGQNYEKSVLFIWDGPADLGTITVNINASQKTKLH